MTTRLVLRFCRRVVAGRIKHLTAAVNFRKSIRVILLLQPLLGSLGLIYLFYDIHLLTMDFSVGGFGKHSSNFMFTVFDYTVVGMVTSDLSTMDQVARDEFNKYWIYENDEVDDNMNEISLWMCNGRYLTVFVTEKGLGRFRRKSKSECAASVLLPDFCRVVTQNKKKNNGVYRFFAINNNSFHRSLLSSIMKPTGRQVLQFAVLRTLWPDEIVFRF